MDMSEASLLLDAELQRLAGTQATIERSGAGTMPSSEDGPDTADSARELVEIRRTYGECEACGDPIPDERLRALPAARYCMFDEQRREGLASA